MPEQRSLADRLHYDGTREYTKRQGDINYLDGTPLKRPVYMPMAQRVIAALFVIAAIIIGCVLINNFVIARWQQVAYVEENLTANLNREASIETVPIVATLINLDNNAIRAKFSEAGYIMYDASDPNDDNEMLLYKLPSDMTIEEAQAIFSTGISSLDVLQGSKFLNGSWQFSADRTGATSMVVRYADFSTADPQIAVQNAIKKEGFEGSTITNSGEDDSGNTFTSGTIDVDGTPCTWKVSALPLNEMYSISGLPEASYVGIRVTAQ